MKMVISALMIAVAIISCTASQENWLNSNVMDLGCSDWNNSPECIAKREKNRDPELVQLENRIQRHNQRKETWESRVAAFELNINGYNKQVKLNKQREQEFVSKLNDVQLNSYMMFLDSLKDKNIAKKELSLRELSNKLSDEQNAELQIIIKNTITFENVKTMLENERDELINEENEISKEDRNIKEYLNLRLAQIEADRTRNQQELQYWRNETNAAFDRAIDRINESARDSRLDNRLNDISNAARGW